MKALAAMPVIRHGDLMLLPAQLPENKEKLTVRENGVVQEGEATGHVHRVDPALAVVFEHKVNWRETDIYVRVGDQPVEITHEEHKALVLPANTTFKVNRAREFDYLSEATRMVLD